MGRYDLPETNIHFPTDCVLLRDGVRTLVASILTIRQHGLRHRIVAPESPLSEINALSMGMAAASCRKPGGKKERKRIFRTLKRLSLIVDGHGCRYRDALDARWEETDLSRPQAEVILRRIDNVLGQLPEARRRAQTEGCIGILKNVFLLLIAGTPEKHRIAFHRVPGIIHGSRSDRSDSDAGRFQLFTCGSD